MRHNGQRRPEEIQADIARTRGDMDATLHAIEQRLTPGQLVDQGLDYLRNSGAREFASNLGGSVKNNPLPVALVGIGIAWLMATGNRKPPYAYTETESSGPGMMQRASERMASTKDSLSQTTQSARERIGQVRQTARQQMDRVKDQAQRIRSGYDAMVQDQPLALGAIGLAIGACLAAVTPRTRQEDELMGEASDRLSQQVTEAGKEQLERAQQVAKAAKANTGENSGIGKTGQTQAPGRPNVIEPARATAMGGEVTPKDPRIGTP
jgi:ElaB/YqjD/DUF883 family membrane-anchored ribosome-binding protein